MQEYTNDGRYLVDNLVRQLKLRIGYHQPSVLPLYFVLYKGLADSPDFQSHYGELPALPAEDIITVSLSWVCDTFH